MTVPPNQALRANRCTFHARLRSPPAQSPMTSTPTPKYARSHLWPILSLLLFAIASVIALATIASPVVNREGSNLTGWPPPCDPVVLLTEYFDNVMPPALPPGWSSTTWVTSNSGVPTPPADTLLNSAFVDDPPTISDKQLISPNISFGGATVRVFFSNNFNLQEGFDGGVLEVSFDNGLTFQDILTAGGTFIYGGYNGSISTCCGNPLAGREAWTGNSGGFIQSTANLPVPFGSTVMLRWRMGSDNSVSDAGWRVDSVAVAVPCRTQPRLRPRPTPAPRP